MIRSTIVGLAGIFLTAGSAMAGGLTPVTVEPQSIIIAPQTATDWSGGYIGLSYGQTAAEGRDGTNTITFNDGTALGGFIGYQWQLGNLVYGAELAYSSISDAYVPGMSGLDDDISHALDLKARVGYGFQRVLVYGAVGYSTSTQTIRHPLDIGEYDWDLSGIGYGVGADFAVNDRLSVGLEYFRREMSGDETTGAYDPIDVDLETVLLRVQYRF